VDTRARSRREEIIETASRLFLERGFQTTSTRAIAEAAGISQPTLYSHFPNKYALLQEVSIPWFEAMAARLAAALEGADRRTAAQRFCRAYIDFAQEDPPHYFLGLVMPNDLDAQHAIAPRFAAATRQAFDQIRRLAGLFQADEAAAEVAAQSVWTALHGLVALVIWRPGFRWVDRETLIARHVAMIVESLEASTRRAAGPAAPRSGRRGRSGRPGS